MTREASAAALDLAAIERAHKRDEGGAHLLLDPAMEEMHAHRGALLDALREERTARAAERAEWQEAEARAVDEAARLRKELQRLRASYDETYLECCRRGDELRALRPAVACAATCGDGAAQGPGWVNGHAPGCPDRPAGALASIPPDECDGADRP